MNVSKAYFHLPGLFEFYEFYKVFLPLYREHREYFYDWCEIGSIYGAPADCLWGGGRVGFGDADGQNAASLLQEYNISARLTFSNSLLRTEHLSDRKCNRLCQLFDRDADYTSDCKSDRGFDHSINCAPESRSDCSPNTENGRKACSPSDRSNGTRNGIIVHSDLLLNYLIEHYPNYYLVSSTTKVLTNFEDFRAELQREEFSYVVPDFRLNRQFDRLRQLSAEEKSKVEFLCNECCSFECTDRKACYENVSRKNLDENCPDHICTSSDSQDGYRFSKAMKNPGFISVDDIVTTYLPMGFSNFKIEGRGLGSAILLEFLLYYMTRPEYQLAVREAIYLDSMLDLF